MPARARGLTGLRFTLDANVLFYAADSADRRHAAAVSIIGAAVVRDCTLTLQAIGEFFNAVSRKGIAPPREAERQAENLLAAFPLATGSAGALRAAMRARCDGRFSYWDAMLLATADEAGCTALISEDMHPGAALGRVRVVRAFEGDNMSSEVRALLA